MYLSGIEAFCKCFLENQVFVDNIADGMRMGSALHPRPSVDEV